VPPENKPTPAEIQACRPFLVAELSAMTRLRAVLALGQIAHTTALAALDERRARFPFAHGALHRLGSGLILADSYHCSRYNTNTGRLTAAMFRDVFNAIRGELRREAA
jgi:uracil-DNA glycosylase